MDDDLAPWLTEQLPRVTSRRDALERGMSRHAIDRRLAAGRWQRVLPRTYLTSDSFTDRDRLTAALSFAGNGAALSGAAALFAGDVRQVGLRREVLVVVPPEICVASYSWVRIRRSTRPIVLEHGPGPRRVHAARAAADLAVTMRRLDDVRTLVARVVQDRHCTTAELAAELEAGPRRGSAHLRQALAEVGMGAASAPEAQAAVALTQAGVAGWIQNASLTLPDGSIRVIDFYWPRLRACLEIDSVEYHFDQVDWTRTWDRHLDLSRFGYSVIHRPPSAIRDGPRFAADVAAWLTGREADLRRGLG